MVKIYQISSPNKREREVQKKSGLIKKERSIMIVFVELIGTLRKKASARKTSVKLEEKTTISTLIQKLNAMFDAEKEFEDQSNFLIMVNGKEINLFNGFQTELKENDVVVIIPISHGG